MKILGIILFAAAAAFFYKDYADSLKDRLDEYEALAALFSHIGASVAEGRRTRAEAIRSFDFSPYNIDSFKESVLLQRREEIEKSLIKIDGEDSSAIADFFTLGASRTVAEELEGIKKISLRIEGKLTSTRDEYPKRRRAAFIVFITAVVCVFFLLI